MQDQCIKLDESKKAEKYFFDSSEAEAWMNKQKLYRPIITTVIGSKEINTQDVMKTQESFENEVDNYSETVILLGDIAKQLVAAKHPKSNDIIIRQAQLDELYSGLKDLACDKRLKIEESLQVYSELEDLEKWIAEKIDVMNSQELGQDYDHITILREEFKTFAKDTEFEGKERFSKINVHVAKLININDSDSTSLTEWKDMLSKAWSESWADLLELIELSTEIFDASWKLHRFFHDCDDVLSRIEEKQNSMLDELGTDAVTVSSLQREHVNFEDDLRTLGSAVKQIQGDSVEYISFHGGEDANKISRKEDEVTRAWQKASHICVCRREKLVDSSDLFRFLNLVKDLMQWMEDTVRLMNTSEKPEGGSGVELLMNNHQSLKAAIDTREENVSVCINLSKELLARNHYASNEIKEKLVTLSNQKTLMMDKWEEKWEHLKLMLLSHPSTPDCQIPFEGPLIRKHERKSTSKKATFRSWKKVYIAVKGHSMLMYKDHNHSKENPNNYCHGKTPIGIGGSTVEIAADYTKREHVFRLKLSGGGEYLFQAKDDDEMNRWIVQIQLVAIKDFGIPGHSDTLPARGEEWKDEQK